jgi:rRNA maturation protein Nop10
MAAACAQRPPHPQDGAKYAVAHVWRFDAEEPWVVELVAAEDREHYQGGFAPEDCTVIRAASCPQCGSRVGSWARVVKCPVCGEALSCH